MQVTEAYRIQPDIFQQTDNKPVIQITQPKQNQHIVFEEVGKMATQMKYIHVVVPLNISVLYTEAEILKNSLTQMANKTTSQKHKIPFTKAVRDTGDYGLLRLQETMEMVNDLNLNLPHNSSHTHHFKEDPHMILKRDIACLYGYSSNPERCDEVRDISQFFLNPLAAIIEAAKGTRWEDSREYQAEKNAALEKQVNNYQTRIDTLYDKLNPTFPETFDDAYYPDAPTTTTSTYRPWTNEWRETYLKKKRDKLYQVLQDLMRDEEFINAASDVPDYYIHSRSKRFIKAFTLFNDVLGTFMGALNAHEIRQLKIKFNSLSEQHNMLVRVTQVHDNEIKELTRNMLKIVEVLDFMAEYNPGLLVMKIDVELSRFYNRVIVLTNAVQQLHHRRLSVDLLSPKQMIAMHESVMEAAHEDGYHPLTTQISDYYQIEVSYTRSDIDIIILVHVPCTKLTSLLTIYRYLPFPIPIPILPKSHDFTIGQSLALPRINETVLDQIFDQNDLDYVQTPEALFITDTTDLIAIGSDDSFQILTQTELAGCIQKNHVYQCDKHHIVKNDLSQSCLGSLYLREERGVRTHCKFERKAVTEMAYQLTKTDHLIYSPNPQTSKINCKNGTTHRIHFDKITKIHLDEGCFIKLQKHTIGADDTITIAPATLQYTWAFDPFVLPANMLTSPAHYDHMLYDIKKDVFELEKQIDERQQLNVFEEMLSTTTFSTNPIALIIWISLAFSSLAIFVLFSIALYYYYYRHRNEQDMEHDQQPPFNPEVPPQLQLPPELLQRLMQVYMQQNVPVRINNPLAIQ